MIPSMIVTVLDQYDKLQKMIDSIDYPVEHAIIMDNGGLLKELNNSSYIKELSIINFPYNLGISIPYNLGIKLTPMAKYWLLTQDDIIWNPGGLEKVHQLSGSDNFCIGMKDQRPFACRTMGENIVAKVGLLDESFFPAPGDEYNYHKRCHYHNINEVDITGTYTAEVSSTILKMIDNNTIKESVWIENYHRSIFDPPIDNGWNLSRRRRQEFGIELDNDLEKSDSFKKNSRRLLHYKYSIHNDVENRAFKEYTDFI